MKSSQVVHLILSIVLGQATVTIAEYGIQPVDAVLLIDGAPTYLRLTNSTSLETVYSCVLENSQNVNSVIMSSQMKGIQLDVGQVEENVNEVIRHLSSEAVRNGRTLWKSPEELKLFKTRLARYLTTNYYENRPVPEPDMYHNYKSQRSADWLHNNLARHSVPNFYRIHPVWGEQPHEQRRQFPIVTGIRSGELYGATPETVERYGITRAASTSIPTAVPFPERVTIPAAVVASLKQPNVSTTETPPSFATVEQLKVSNDPSVSTPGWPDSTPFTKQANIIDLNQQNNSESRLHSSKSIHRVDQNSSSFSMREYAKVEPQITTGISKEPEVTVSVQGLFSMGKSNKDVVEIEENPGARSIYEEVQSRAVSRGRFKTEGVDAKTPAVERNVTHNSDQTVTESGHSPHVGPSDESSVVSEKPKKKAKGKRKSGKKRVAKSRQQSSMAMSDLNTNGED